MGAHRFLRKTSFFGQSSPRHSSPRFSPHKKDRRRTSAARTTRKLPKIDASIQPPTGHATTSRPTKYPPIGTSTFGKMVSIILSLSTENVLGIDFSLSMQSVSCSVLARASRVCVCWLVWRRLSRRSIRFFDVLYVI